MKKLLIVLALILLVTTACSKDTGVEVTPEPRVNMFKELFGKDYKYAIDFNGNEWFYWFDVNQINIVQFSQRKVYTYEGTTTFEATKSENYPTAKFHKRVNRAMGRGSEPDGFTQNNLDVYLDEDATLFITTGSDSGNIQKTEEYTLVKASILPQLNKVIDSALLLKGSLPDMTAENTYLTSEYDVVYINPERTTAYIYWFDEILTVPIKEEIPEVDNNFAEVYLRMVEDTYANSYVADVYGLNDYEIRIGYGQYYLCIDTEDSTQLFYNKETNFYEWIVGD